MLQRQVASSAFSAFTGVVIPYGAIRGAAMATNRALIIAFAVVLALIVVWWLLPGSLVFEAPQITQ